MQIVVEHRYHIKIGKYLRQEKLSQITTIVIYAEHAISK